MQNRFERTLSSVLTLTAVVMAVSLVHREWFSGAEVARAASAHPRRIANWQEIVRAGIPLGDTIAPVTMVEFGDFECPFCRRFEQRYANLEQPLRQSVDLVFVEFPLTAIHRFALPAARAAECARDQGRFRQMHDLLFQKQDSLGLVSWNSLAVEASVPDTLAFARCNLAVAPLPNVMTGLKLGQTLNVHSTPTVLVNGWLVPVPQDDSTLRAVIQAAAKGDRTLQHYLEHAQ